MTFMTNEDRARRGADAMIAYTRDDYTAKVLQEVPVADWGETGQEVLQDLLNDLRHLADMAGLDFDLADYSGERSYIEELIEEAIQAKEEQA